MINKRADIRLEGGETAVIFNQRVGRPCNYELRMNRDKQRKVGEAAGAGLEEDSYSCKGVLYFLSPSPSRHGEYRVCTKRYYTRV